MISLVGLDPAARRRYQWLGDPACDVAASDVDGWLATGDGLKALEGQELTTLVCEPLRPTTLAIVHGHAFMAPTGDEPAPSPVALDSIVSRNMPAVYRAAVAYGVVAVENGGPFRRVHDAGGPRLDDATLDRLDRMRVRPSGGAPLSLMMHLGGLILQDSTHTDLEGKA